MNTPSSIQIRQALENGNSLSDIDELFYPGEKSNLIKRKSNYPIPQGTNRKRPNFCKIKYKNVFKRSQYTIGCRTKTRIYIENVYIGTINEIRNNACDIHFETHDGEKFAHWGDSQGAETYLIERYWLYGNPPKSIYEYLKNLLKIR